MATASEIRVRILQLGRQVIDHRADQVLPQRVALQLAREGDRGEHEAVGESSRQPERAGAASRSARLSSTGARSGASWRRLRCPRSSAPATARRGCTGSRRSATARPECRPGARPGGGIMGPASTMALAGSTHAKLKAHLLCGDGKEAASILICASSPAPRPSATARTCP